MGEPAYTPPLGTSVTPPLHDPPPSPHRSTSPPSVSPLDSLSSPWRPGTIIDNQYEIVERFFQGGMGTLYRASCKHTGQTRVIKALHSSSPDPHGELAERFDSEIRILSSLHHPNILPMIDCGYADDGSPFFVAPFIQGQPLSEILDHSRLTLYDALSIWAQIALGLAAVHQLDVVHRDVKPENIMVTWLSDRELHATLIDFGVARHLDEIGERTRPGIVVGTLSAMAPEVLLGTSVSPSTDLFAFGLILLRMITGEPLCPYTDPELLLSFYDTLTQEDVAALFPSSTPQPLMDAVCDLLHFDHQNRPSNAADVAQRLMMISKSLPFDVLRQPLHQRQVPASLLAEPPTIPPSDWSTFHNAAEWTLSPITIITLLIIIVLALSLLSVFLFLKLYPL